MADPTRIVRTWESTYNPSTGCREMDWDELYTKYSWNNTTTNGTAKILDSYTAEDGYSYAIYAIATCANGTGELYGMYRKGVCARVNATGNLVLNGTSTFLGLLKESNGTFDFDITVNGTTNAIQMYGTGQASVELYWAGHTEIVKLVRS